MDAAAIIKIVSIKNRLIIIKTSSSNPSNWLKIIMHNRVIPIYGIKKRINFHLIPFVMVELFLKATDDPTC